MPAVIGIAIVCFIIYSILYYMFMYLFIVLPVILILIYISSARSLLKFRYVFLSTTLIAIKYTLLLLLISSFNKDPIFGSYIYNGSFELYGGYSASYKASKEITIIKNENFISSSNKELNKLIEESENYSYKEEKLSKEISKLKNLISFAKEKNKPIIEEAHETHSDRNSVDRYYYGYLDTIGLKNHAYISKIYDGNNDRYTFTNSNPDYSIELIIDKINKKISYDDEIFDGGFIFTTNNILISTSITLLLTIILFASIVKILNNKSSGMFKDYTREYIIKPYKRKK